MLRKFKNPAKLFANCISISYAVFSEFRGLFMSTKSSSNSEWNLIHRYVVACVNKVWFRNSHIFGLLEFVSRLFPISCVNFNKTRIILYIPGSCRCGNFLSIALSRRSRWFWSTWYLLSCVTTEFFSFSITPSTYWRCCLRVALCRS